MKTEIVSGLPKCWFCNTKDQCEKCINEEKQNRKNWNLFIIYFIYTSALIILFIKIFK